MQGLDNAGSTMLVHELISEDCTNLAGVSGVEMERVGGGVATSVACYPNEAASTLIVDNSCRRSLFLFSTRTGDCIKCTA